MVTKHKRLLASAKACKKSTASAAHNQATRAAYPSDFYTRNSSNCCIGKLILSYNPLGGSIPRSMGNLSSLNTLELKQNGLSGKIPVELGKAIELRTIVLSGNKLRGSIPGVVLNLRELREFDVSDNKLSGKIPPPKASIPATSFKGNPGLCGSPLPPCKHAS